MSLIPFPRALSDSAGVTANTRPAGPAPVALLHMEGHRCENALAPATAHHELRAGAGTQFDPDLVDALSKLLERGLVV